MRWIGTAFLGIGVLMLLIAAALFESERRFLARASHTTGTVVQLIEHRSQKGSRSWAPRVTFRDATGAARVFEGSVASFPAKHRVGDSVHVIYDETKADIDDTVSRWLKVWICSAAAVIFGAVGYGLRRS